MKRGNSGENSIQIGELWMKYHFYACLVEEMRHVDFLK